MKLGISHLVVVSLPARGRENGFISHEIDIRNLHDFFDTSSQSLILRLVR